MSTLIIITGVMLLLVLILLMGLNYIAAKGQTPRRLAASMTPSVPYEDIVVLNEKNELKGWFIPSGSVQEKSPLIIVVHGWGSSKQRMLRYASPLLESGYSLLLFDVRGHGESSDVKICSAKTFRSDILAVLAYAKNRSDVDHDRIGILAHSFGGFSSVVANTEHIGIKALVTDSIPTRFETMVQASLAKINIPLDWFVPLIAKLMYIKAGITKQDLKRFSVPEALNKQISPLLLVHSRLDDYVPVTELTHLIEQKKIDSDLVDYVIVESKGHSVSEQDPLFWEKVLPFIKKYV